ncbi:MAG: creatininase family protein [Gammaproteobacteria bacterium]|nr:creatininase family protein [Gammaproteobacteria bacterium]
MKTHPSTRIFVFSLLFLLYGCEPATDEAEQPGSLEQQVEGLWFYTGLITANGEEEPLDGIFLFRDGFFVQYAQFTGASAREQGAMAHAGPYSEGDGFIRLAAEQTLSTAPSESPPLTSRGLTEHEVDVQRVDDELTLNFMRSGTVQKFVRAGPGDGKVYRLENGALALVDGYLVLVSGDENGVETGYGRYEAENGAIRVDLDYWTSADKTSASNKNHTGMNATFDGESLTLEDGRRFHVLTPGRHELEKKTWKEVEAALEQGIDTAIITIGATEQHGPQLALATDSASGDCLARMVAERVGQALITPNIRVGISPHHMRFAGTISVRAPILKSLVYEYVHSLAWHGFRHIAIIPTHGTNFPMAGELEPELQRLYPHVNIFSYSDADAYLGSAAVVSEHLGIDPATAGTHAGLSETAFMLACQPDLVDLESAEQGFMGDAMAMGEKLNRDGTHSISPIGVLGDPRGATVEAGREYLESRAALLADYVMERREGWTPEIPGDLPYGGLPEPEGDLADAVRARRNGDFDAARQMLQEKLQEQPGDPMIVLELARIDTLEDRIDSARASLESLLAETTDDETQEKIHDELALLSTYQGRFSEAAEHKLESKRLRGLRNDPAGEGLKLFYIAYFQAETGRVDEAIESYGQALELARDPSDINLDIEHLVGLALVKKGRLLDAAQRLRVIGDSVNEPEFRSHIRRFYHLNGEILLLLNRPEDAAMNFQATLKIYDHPLYRESMARAKWQAGDLEGAIAEMERLVALTDPRLDIPIHYVKAHYQLGQLYEQQGDRDRARDWYHRFLQFWGSSDMDLEEIREARKKTTG